MQIRVLNQCFVFRITRIRIALAAIFLTSLIAMVCRFVFGLSAVTNLNDQYPWGLWISLDVVGGVALGAGAFATAAIVYIFGQEKFHALARPAVLTGFLGYLMVIFSLLLDLGQPWDIWHPIVMWQPHSAMFEVAWCVMLYTTVLFLEFLPSICEKFGWEMPTRLVKRIYIPLVIAGIILSTLHQSSLGTLLLILPDKLHALWYTPLLPLMFFVSSIILGLAVVLFEAILVGNSMKINEIPLLSRFAKGIPAVVHIYVILKLADIVYRGELSQVFVNNMESWTFITEMLLLIVPAYLLLFKSIRTNKTGLLTSAVVLIVGVLLNRLNASSLGLAHYFNKVYVPSFTELLITLGLISLEVLIYIFIVENFPVIEEHAKGTETKSQSSLV